MADAIEEVLISGDLGGLSPSERVDYYNRVCASLGLNPLTEPFAYIELNKKLKLYALKSATDQLRKLNSVSIRIVDRREHNGVWMVTARAMLPNGREDESIGAVDIKGKGGDNLANALMKAETKAKRRVTLSICGLGMLDESEVEAIHNAQFPTMPEQEGPKAFVQQGEEFTQEDEVIIQVEQELDYKQVFISDALKYLPDTRTIKRGMVALGHEKGAIPEDEEKRARALNNLVDWWNSEKEQAAEASPKPSTGQRVVSPFQRQKIAELYTELYPQEEDAPGAIDAMFVTETGRGIDRASYDDGRQITAMLLREKRNRATNTVDSTATVAGG